MAALFVVVVWRPSLSADAARYTVENLGGIDGMVPTITAINESGQVAGYVNGPDGPRAVRYTDGHGWEYLPGLDTAYSVANGINASGDLAGYHFTGTGALRAFRYRDGTGVEDIAPLAGGSMTLAYTLNASGDVVGYSDATGGTILGFVASPGLPAVALPSLGGSFALACGINDAGQIVGSGLTTAGTQHAFRLDPGQTTPIEIGSFDGPGGNSTGCAVDADGRVGGQADQGGATRAFRFQNGTLLNLDAFGSTQSNVESIAAGISVGWFTSPADDTLRAFVHTSDDGSNDLNTRLDGGDGWTLSVARGVNANGMIAGEGFFNGAPAVFRLTPVTPSDTTAPVIEGISATPATIWPPNGKWVPVAVTATATDDVDASPVCTLTSITGAPSTDFALTGALTANVRARQNSDGSARTYTLHVGCADAAGNTSTATVDVNVANGGKPAKAAALNK